MNETLKKFTEEVKAEMQKVFSGDDFRTLIEKTKAATDSGNFEVVISTADFDRQGETIDQDGWDFSHYLKNPVVLWAHDYWTLPIGITEELSKGANGETIARGKFAPAEANPFAQQVRQLYDLKIVRATSVGFIAKEMEGSVVKKAELLEFSFVPVPANPFALSLSKAQELGLDLPMLATKGIAIKTEEEKAKQKSPACRMEDETEEECRARKIPELMEEGMDQEQAVAVAIDICQTPCEKKRAKKDIEKIGAELSAMQSEVDDAIVRHSQAIIEIVRSEYGEEEAEKIQKAIEQKKTAVVGAKTEGSGGEETRGGESPKQRSDSAGVEAALKELDEFLLTRQLLRSVSNEVSNAIERMNKKIRETRMKTR